MIQSHEETSKIFCLWLAEQLRTNHIQKEQAEEMALAFFVGLNKTTTSEELGYFLEGLSEVFPETTDFQERLKNEEGKAESRKTEKDILDFAKTSTIDPKRLVEFLQLANKGSDSDALAASFPEFKAYLEQTKENQ